MCLAVVAVDRHPRYRLVIASNRDEYYERPTEPSHWWPDAILAGRDLQAGGTWLGITPEGRWALVTNFREGVRPPPGSPSRGRLVPRLLGDPAPIGGAFATLADELATYPGCNLLGGELDQAFFASNREPGMRKLAPGVHALSNGPIDAAWPKLTRTKRAVESWLLREGAAIEELLEALHDGTRAADEELPRTGVPLEWERVLSSPFIAGDAYGTRCSAVVAVAGDGGAVWAERRFGPRGVPDGESRHEFRVGDRQPAARCDPTRV